MHACTIGCFILAAITGLARAQLDPGDPNAATLRAFCESRLPRAGAWEALFTVGGPDSASTVRCGYQWGTGAAFRAAPHGGFGRTASGEFFQIAEPSMRTPILTGAAALPLNIAKLDDHMPALLLLSLLREDRELEFVTPVEGGGLRVGVLWPAASSNPPAHMAGAVAELVQLEFDARGRLVRREQGTGRWHLVWTFEYDSRSPPDFPIPGRVVRTAMSDGAVNEYNLVEVRTHTPSDPISFDPEYVRSRVIQADQRAADTLGRARTRPSGVTGRSVNQEGAGTRPSSGAASSPPPNGPSQQANAPPPRMPATLSPYERYRWPLILSGTIVAGIGALAWWKRART
jgi:hypothetical protein